MAGTLTSRRQGAHGRHRLPSRLLASGGPLRAPGLTLQSLVHHPQPLQRGHAAQHRLDVARVDVQAVIARGHALLESLQPQQARRPVRVVGGPLPRQRRPQRRRRHRLLVQRQRRLRLPRREARVPLRLETVRLLLAPARRGVLLLRHVRRGGLLLLLLGLRPFCGRRLLCTLVHGICLGARRRRPRSFAHRHCLRPTACVIICSRSRRRASRTSGGSASGRQRAGGGASAAVRHQHRGLIAARG